MFQCSGNGVCDRGDLGLQVKGSAFMLLAHALMLTLMLPHVRLAKSVTRCVCVCSDLSGSVVKGNPVSLCAFATLAILALAAR